MKKLKSKIFIICADLMIRVPFLYIVTRFFLPRIKKLNIKPLYDYVNSERRIIKRISDETVREYHGASSDIKEYENGLFNKSDIRECSRQYVCMVHNAIVRGDTDGIIQGEVFLTDKVLFDEKGFREHLPYQTFVRKKEMIIECKKSNEKAVYEHAVSLIKMWSYNYFHFVFEGLSRLGSVDNIAEYKHWPIILDECVKSDPRNLDIINLLNENNREIIWIERGESIEVRKLIVPACMTWATWDINTAVENGWGYMISKDAGEYLRRTILSKYAPNRGYNCVFIARGNNKRLTNESTAIEIFKNAGFEIFYPDKAKTFQDELDCFSTAKCIVLCAGGASTNLVFCRKDVDVFCILPYKYRCDSSHDITNTVGIIAKHVNAKIEEDNGMLMGSKFSIPVEKCFDIISYCRQRGYIHFS